MGSIVIAMPRHEDAARLRDIFLCSGRFSDVATASQGAEVLRMAEDRDVALVVCTKRFSDMGYEEMVSYLPRGIPVILLTKSASLVPFSDNVMKLLMPFKSADLIATASALLPDFRRKRKKGPSRSPEEQKLIDSAKRALMDRNDMTEPEAFRYLQKTSMDTGRTLIETAQMVNDLYGR